MASRGGNPLRGMMDEGQVRRRSRFSFIAEVYAELTRVTWPDRQSAFRLALLVIGVAAVPDLVAHLAGPAKLTLTAGELPLGGGSGT